jgi:hypothetical protein
VSAHALPNRYLVTEQGEWTRDLPRREAWAPSAQETAGMQLLALLALWGGGVAPLYRDASPLPFAWLDCSKLDHAAEGLLRRAARAREGYQLEMGLPEASQGNGGPGACTILWCWAESRDQVRRAARFRPLPSLVLRMGKSCRRLLIWGLSENVAYVSGVPANRRLAYALHAPQKWAQPEKLRVPLPGTFLRADRKRPCPVEVTRVDDAVFTRSEIVGRLRDPPPDFMTRLRAGEIKR